MNDYNTSNVVSVTDQYAALADLRREYCASGHAYQSFETWLCIQVKRLRAAHETGQSLQQQILVGIDAALKHPMRTPVAEILGNIRALLTQETFPPIPYDIGLRGPDEEGVTAPGEELLGLKAAAPRTGPRLGDPHPPSCACWECNK